jgi:elongator complex protein 1
MLEVYGDYLYERHEYRQAAMCKTFPDPSPNDTNYCCIVFVEAGATRKAMVAYERALLWRELFELASQTLVKGERVEGEDEGESEGGDIVNMAYRVAGDRWSMSNLHRLLRPFL